MSSIRLGSDYIKESYTQVDNVFLLQYLPAADPLDVKIYLMALSVAQTGCEMELNDMALALHITEDRLMDGFSYWEKKGLVSISKTVPTAISFLSVKRPLPPIIKYNAEKYKVFCEEINRLYPDKILTPNEYNKIIELMAENDMEINAMLLCFEYCKELGGTKSGVSYVLAVASDWIKQGLTTEKAVSEHIAELENNCEDVRSIFKALNIKRNADLDDRQKYLKWTTKYGYKLDAILVAARAQKRRGGMEKLDEYMEILYKAEAYTAEAVAAYTENRENVYNLSVKISKALGTFYGSIEGIAENYVQPWINLGFDDEALLKLANFCLLRNIRSFDGLQQTVTKAFRLGLITEQGIAAYVEKQIAMDDKIREVLDIVGGAGIITNKDRESYRVWLDWGFTEEIIKLAAEKNYGSPFPMQAINRSLAFLRENGIFDKEKAAGYLVKTSAKTEKKEKNDDGMKRKYTDEQLKSVLSDFDNWD